MINSNDALKQTIDMLYRENEELKKEIVFIMQRNKELRQKSYINVYDENLKLIDENKALKHENEVKYNDLVKYERTIEQLRKELIQVGKVADKYYQEYINFNNENNHLKDVLKSVEKFIQQYSI